MQKLILRVGAIVILISLLEKVPFTVEALSNSWESSHDIYTILYSLSPGIFALIICFLLWFFPSTISSKLSDLEDISRINPGHLDLLSGILISIVGVFIFANAIPDLVYHIVLHIESARMNIDILPVDRAALIATFFEVVIGGVLIYGSDLISNLINRFHKELNTESL